jgi:hypothetical protein
MGWGINIPNVFYSRITISELEGRRADLEETITMIRTKIFMYAVSEPTSAKDIEENEINKVDNTYYELKQMLDDYEDIVRELHLCYIALDNKDTIKDT